MQAETRVSQYEVIMRIIRLGAALAALVLSAHLVAAQQPAPPQQPDRRPSGMAGPAGMAAQMQMMDSLNARLDTLVSRMNPGDRQPQGHGDGRRHQRAGRPAQGYAGAHAPDDGVPERDDAHDGRAGAGGAPCAQAEDGLDAR